MYTRWRWISSPAMATVFFLANQAILKFTSQTGRFFRRNLSANQQK
jgi:hypothetical protein